VSRKREVAGLDPRLDLDLDRALKCLRRGLGDDQVVVLTVTPHSDPATLERLARTAEDLTLWED
jgi:hypothetical protein